MDFIAATNQILEMDKAGRAEETIPLIRDMLAQPFKVPGILLAAIVYSLYTTRILTEEGGVKAKWEVCQLDQGKPISGSWSEFCGSHLGLNPTTASSYRRIWEVFVVDLDYSLGSLAGVGLGNLANVVGTVARLPLQKQLQIASRLVEDENGQEGWSRGSRKRRKRMGLTEDLSGQGCCLVCGGSVTQPSVGRPRLICSNACRMAWCRNNKRKCPLGEESKGIRIM